MTALTMPSQPRREAIVRPVPWRRMAWVTWRQHRLTLAGVIVVLGAASLYLYTTGGQIRADSDLIAARSGMSVTAALFQLIPALIGAFVGAPAVARELDTGTFRFTWTQGFGRTRWTVATLAPLALTVTVAAGAFGLAFSWCYGSLIAGRDGFVALSPLTNITFDLRGVAVAGWTLVAFAIGVLAGVLIRRVVPAMFATIAAWSGLALLTAVYLRRHYEPPLVTHTPSLPSADWVLTQSWAQGGKPVSSSAINQILQKIGATIATPGQLGSAPAPGRGKRACQRGKHESCTVPPPRNYVLRELPAGQPVLVISMDRGGLAAGPVTAPHDRDRLAGPPASSLSSTRRAASGKCGAAARPGADTRQPGSGRPGRAVGRTGRGRGVIAGGSVAVPRQALIAHEKAGVVVRLKGGRTGVPESRQPVDGELAPGPDSGAGPRPVTWTGLSGRACSVR